MSLRPEIDPMTRFSTALTVATLSFAPTLLASAASGQMSAIGAGETVQGRLESGDRQLDDDSWFDLYEYRGSPGETVVVTLRSADFDAYLQMGPVTNGTLDATDSDDDGAGGTDAALTVTLTGTGLYQIRANSWESGQSGAYSLSVESDRAPASEAATLLRPGQTVSGALASGDRQLDDDSYFDLYEYRGRSGETIVAILRSGDFDAYLQGGPPAGDDLEFADSDDDGAGGRDAQLTVTLSGDGIYRFRANSLGANETGSYTFAVQSDATEAPAGSTLRAGQTVSGRLDTTDPQLGDDSHYDLWYYDGAPGERILVTMRSSDFDSYLSWGHEGASGFDAIASDDDGAGNTDSRVEVTLEGSGRYAIRANSFAGGQTGAYTLTVESAGGATTGLPSIALGQTLSSSLDAADPLRSDDSHYEIYLHRGPPGSQVVVTMRSNDFDSYLQAGRSVGGQFEADASDDDSGGGTDAQLLATVGPDGSLVILANSYAAGVRGGFTLEVESIGGSAGSAAETAARESGLPTARAGESLTGSLVEGDPTMADSTFFDPWVYIGNPGDRLRITLASDDFDAYLGWGRLEEGRFTGAVYDDDSAGGRNAELEVTVDGTGVFAVLANTYTAGEIGDYTLQLERLEGSGASAPVAGGSGKWLYRYDDAATPSHRALSQRVKQYGSLEEITAALQERYTLPNPIEIRFAGCDMINAYYHQSSITFCYELLEFLADTFVPDGQWTEEQRANVFGAVEFIMMHEVGHALVDVLDLPITGREEDVADQLAVYVLLRGSEKGAQAAVAGVSALQPSTTDFDTTQLADEHSLGPVRLYNVMCWIYGSDPIKYQGIVTSGSLPEDRAVRCAGEWDRMAKAWQRLLASHRP